MSLTRTRVQVAALDLHCSQSQVMSETIEQTLCQAESTEPLVVPEILTRLRMIRALKNKPALAWNPNEPPSEQKRIPE